MLIHDLDRARSAARTAGNACSAAMPMPASSTWSRAKPELGDTFGAFDLTLGNYDLTRLKGHLNVPLGEHRSRCAAPRSWSSATATSPSCPARTSTRRTPRYDDSDKLALRLSGLWEPNEAWSVFASAERYADRGAGTIPVSLKPAPGHGAALGADHLARRARHEERHLPPAHRLRAIGDLEAQLSVRLGAHDARERQRPGRGPGARSGAARAAESAAAGHLRRGAAHRGCGVRIHPARAAAQAARAASGCDWIAGALLLPRKTTRSASTSTCATIAACMPGVPDAGDVRYSQAFIQPDRTLSAWAGFGQLTWHLSDRCARQRGRALHRRHQAGSQRHQRRLPDAERHHRQRRLQSRRHSPPATFPSRRIRIRRLRCRAPAASPRTTTLTRTGPRSPTWRASSTTSAKTCSRYALTNSGFKSGVIQDGGTLRGSRGGRELRARAQGHLVRRLDGGEHGGLLLRLFGHPARAHRVRCARHAPAGDAQCHARAHLRHRIRAAVEAGAERRAAGRFHISQRRVPRLSHRGFPVLRGHRSADAGDEPARQQAAVRARIHGRAGVRTFVPSA